MKMLLFYLKQQKVCLPVVHGIPLKLRGQVRHGKLHPYLHGLFPQAMLLFSDNTYNMHCLIFNKYCRFVINNPMEDTKYLFPKRLE